MRGGTGVYSFGEAELCRGLPGFRGTATGGADVVEGDGATAEKDEGKCQGGQSEREFVSVVADQSVVEMYLGDGDGKIDADGKCGDASEQAQQNEQAPEELNEGGEVSAPGGESEADDEVGVVAKSAENFVVTVAEHDGAQSETDDEEREGLQAVEVAHVVPPAERKIDYSSGTKEGSRDERRLPAGFGRAGVAVRIGEDF